MSIVRATIIASLLLLSGCSDMMDDLNPVGTDKSSSLSQPAADITVLDSLGNTINVPSDYIGTPVVLYFTMWCPVCDQHTTDMLNNTVPNFPGVEFFLVDYVSSSVAQVRSNELGGGYGTSFTTLADINDFLENYYDGAMGATVVIDATGIIRMNEDYLDGSRLRTVLGSL
ncbi:MAG: peroxiredoxin family protein [Deltaproteobacteria bacterium]|nr:peroxiredoxin family protein [Deltaproteobacteria bacterium]